MQRLYVENTLCVREINALTPVQLRWYSMEKRFMDRIPLGAH